MRKSHLTIFVREFFVPELRAWRGELPLWKVFWLYGIGVSGVMITFYALGFYLDHVALRQALLLFFAPYTFWILVSVWRCANNTDNQFWSVIARLLAVAWAINSVLAIAFVQINLITHYYLGLK